MTFVLAGDPKRLVDDWNRSADSVRMPRLKGEVDVIPRSPVKFASELALLAAGDA